MRIRAHATLALGCQFCQFWSQPSFLVKEFFRVITLHPLFKRSQVVRLLRTLRKGDLMRAKRALDLFAILNLWSRPAFWCAQNDHRPLWALPEPILAHFSLNRLDLCENSVECGVHELMHYLGRVALNEVGFMTVPDQQVCKFVLT